MNAYLINGITKNWRVAFSNNPPIWGFTDREKSGWDRLRDGDVIYFYASGEARGIIGKGLVLNKFRQDNLVWPEEVRGGFPKWPWRFYFKPLILLKPANWLDGKGPIKCSSFDMKGVSLQGKQIISLNDNQINKIENQIVLWGNDIYIGPTQDITRLPSSNNVTIKDGSHVIYEYSDLHTELINIVSEMGELQDFYVQKEFSIPEENKRIDVIWKRELAGTPTYAFEVELSGGIDRAVNKLYKCYNLWNTLPRLIIPTNESPKVERISSLLGIKDIVRTISPELIKEIHKKKKDFKMMEKEIGLL